MAFLKRCSHYYPVEAKPFPFLYLLFIYFIHTIWEKFINEPATNKVMVFYKNGEWNKCLRQPGK